MLSALVHDSFISSNHKEHKVYAACACEHIPDKPLMSRNIYNSNHKAVRITEVCKTKINRDASLFLLFKPVRVYPRQGFNEGALPVVYMACSSKYYVTHSRSSPDSFKIPFISAFLKSSFTAESPSSPKSKE